MTDFIINMQGVLGNCTVCWEIMRSMLGNYTGVLGNYARVVGNCTVCAVKLYRVCWEIIHVC